MTTERRQPNDSARPDEPAHSSARPPTESASHDNNGTQDERLLSLADRFNRFHEAGQKSRADELLAFWNAGEVVVEIECLVGYERGGGLKKLIDEGRLKVGKTQCYRYRDLYAMFPVNGTLSLWEAGYTVDEVEQAWRRIQGNTAKTKGKRKGKGKGGKIEDAPGDDLFMTVILNPDNVILFHYLFRGTERGRNLDHEINRIVYNELRRMIDDEERGRPHCPNSLDEIGRMGEQMHQEDDE